MTPRELVDLKDAMFRHTMNVWNDALVSKFGVKETLDNLQCLNVVHEMVCRELHFLEEVGELFQIGHPLIRASDSLCDAQIDRPDLAGELSDMINQLRTWAAEGRHGQ